MVMLARRQADRFADVADQQGPAGLGLAEQKVVELGGIKSLYSDSYFPRGEFERLYGGDTYRQLKAKYDPDGAFPGLYEKCVLKA